MYVDAFQEHGYEFEHEVIKLIHCEKGHVVMGAMEGGFFGQFFPEGVPVYSTEVGLVHCLLTMRSRIVWMGR